MARGRRKRGLDSILFQGGQTVKVRINERGEIFAGGGSKRPSTG